MKQGSKEIELPALATHHGQHTQKSPTERAGNPYRFMCVLRFPWLDRSRGKIEWGLNCTGCRDKFHDRTDRKLDWRWLYTTSGYVEHFGQCRKSIEILEAIG
jgi:hypothetical protein